MRPYRFLNSYSWPFLVGIKLRYIVNLSKISIIPTSFLRSISLVKNAQKPPNLNTFWEKLYNYRSCRPEVLLGKDVLKICSKFTGQHPCQSAISIKLQNNFIEIALRHGCSVVNLLHILRTSFPKNSSGWLFLKIVQLKKNLIKWKNFQNGLSLWKLQEMRSM